MSVTSKAHLVPLSLTTYIWELAQRQLAGNRHFREAKNHNPFTGLLRCGLCGYTLRTGYNHSTTPVWECPGRLKRLHLDGSTRCTLPRMDAFEMNVNLAYFISEIFTDETKLRKYIQDTIHNLQKERDLLERKLRPIQANTKHIQEQMGKADTMFELGRLSREDYRARITGLRKRLKELEKQTTAADPLLLKQMKDTDGAIYFYEKLPAHLDDLMISTKRIAAKLPELENDEDFFQDFEVAACIHVVASSFGVYQKGQALDQTLSKVAVKISDYMRRFGFYAFIYPESIEFKGAIRQTSVTPGYRSDRYRQSQ